MKKFIIAAITSLSLIATPALARDHIHHRDRNISGEAIAAGVVGLILGAAIASDSRKDRRRYQKRRHHRDRYNYRNRRAQSAYVVCDEYSQPVAYSKVYWNNGRRYTRVDIRCE